MAFLNEVNFSSSDTQTRKIMFCCFPLLWNFFQAVETGATKTFKLRQRVFKLCFFSRSGFFSLLHFLTERGKIMNKRKGRNRYTQGNRQDICEHKNRRLLPRRRIWLSPSHPLAHSHARHAHSHARHAHSHARHSHAHARHAHARSGGRVWVKVGVC